MQLLILTLFLSLLSTSLSLPFAIQSRDAPVSKAAAKAKPSASKVQQAADNFANDAMTVSASLNSLGTATDTKKIKTLATTGFNAETDEDAQRAVLSAAAGSAGSASNDKIVKNTPAVLDGLKAMMQNPSTKAVAKNLKTIEAARNPQILPSITQLSNSALKAVGMPATAAKFPSTNAAVAAAASN